MTIFSLLFFALLLQAKAKPTTIGIPATAVSSVAIPTPPGAAAKKILIYSATKGFRHESIPDGIAAIKKIGAAHGWLVTATEDSAVFSDNKIQAYSAIVLLSTTGNVFDSKGEKALQDYVRAGGGVAGIHAATDCEYDWQWYNQFMGAQFESHPEQQVATLHKTANTHPATAMLPDDWSRKDEWYNFKNFNDKVTVILTLDEGSYKGGKMNGHHPAAWYQEMDGGKQFYTTLGHTKESWSEPLFLQHVEKGIESVMR